MKLVSIKLKYGREEVNIQPEADSFLGVIQSRGLMNNKTEEEVILEALKNPIGSQRLKDIVNTGETVCIIISDITRSWQKMDLYLPYIVNELNEAGITDDSITFLCATGSHRAQTEEEHKSLLGEKLAHRFKVKNHDCRDWSNLVKLGTTSFGTPVAINKTAAESDHVILTGAIIFHDLAGWGGGKKSVLPGIAAYDSIMANHSLSLNPIEGEGLNPLVRCGNADSNPVHLDMLEAAAFLNPSFLFNVIIDENGNIGKAVAGNYVKAHEAGRQLVDEADSAYIREKADIIVVSAGGYPKDIDLYQASKALINAKEAVKEGGTIVFLAECIEGVGGEEVEMMLREFDNNSSRERALRDGFTVAKYTGYLIAKIAESFNVILVASLDPKQLVKSGIKVVASVEEALSISGAVKGSGLKTYYMPNGANTLPRLYEAMHNDK